MPVVEVTPAYRIARANGLVSQADAGPDASRIKLYDIKGAGRVHLADVVLAKPCGLVDGAGLITLQPADVPEVAVASGLVGWAEWCAGDGTYLIGGDVSDEAGDGTFKLKGSGGSGTQVFAGGIVLLTLVTVG